MVHRNIHEGVDSIVDEVNETAGGPNITFGRVGLIQQLLGGGVDRSALVHREIIDG